MPSLDLLRPILDVFNKQNRAPRQERLATAVAGEIGHAKSLLDVGCGAGRITHDVAQRIGAERVIGVDIVKWSDAAIDVELYDGRSLPFPDKSFEAVTVVDVLHHCTDQVEVLRECVRVAQRVVVVKDHFTFGFWSDQVLKWMDGFGNKEDIPMPARWLRFSDWVAMHTAAGARMVNLRWPLPMHDFPWSIVARSELQFVATLLPVR